MKINLKTNWKIYIVFLVALISILAIEPKLNTDGVRVTQAVSPGSDYVPIGSMITRINNFEINNVEDFQNAIDELSGQTLYIKYKEKRYPYIYKDNEAYPFRINQSTGLTVANIKQTNIDFGLEMEGGTRVLLSPERALSDSEKANLLEILRQRLNVYGLKDIPITDFSGTDGTYYIRIEFAGVSREEVEGLLSQQGKFEARIRNNTVFTGTETTGVCVGGDQCTRRVDRYVTPAGEEYWQYSLQLDITQEAAERFAVLTAGLKEECVGQQCYLNETLDFYIDDKPVEGGSLNIVSNLKGKVITSAVITGTRDNRLDTENELKRMQAILQSGSLPVSLNVEKMDTVSPLLGKEFAKNVFLVFFLAIIFVDLVMLGRYRNVKIFVPMVLIALVEIIATLGVAALIKWTMDLPSIAGLLAAVGTGLDDQIVIVDEFLRGRKKEESAPVDKRIKKAFFIVIAAFVTSVLAMFPLAFAGAGILRGFAITTIIAVTIGVVITRPAFAEIMKKVIKD